MVSESPVTVGFQKVSKTNMIATIASDITLIVNMYSTVP
jgi:hypothetical protein